MRMERVHAVPLDLDLNHSQQETAQSKACERKSARRRAPLPDHEK
jgi:hypothetical protein